MCNDWFYIDFNIPEIYIFENDAQSTMLLVAWIQDQGLIIFFFFFLSCDIYLYHNQSSFKQLVGN